ncbi:MAG: uroporphyrinogen-III synthase [Micavibrio sp.]
MKPRKILITKTIEDSELYAQAVRTAGFEPLVEPMLSIASVAEAPYARITGGAPLIFTSPHAVRAFARNMPDRRHFIYAVGRDTAETARSEGFESIETGAGTADDLVKMLLAKPKEALDGLFYIRSVNISRDLKGILAENGVNIGEVTAYRADIADILSIDLLKSLDHQEINAVMLFSRRGAGAFADLIEQYGRTVRLKKTKALCISEGVLESVSVLPFQKAMVAGSPDRHGMMELLGHISVSKDDEE